MSFLGKKPLTQAQINGRFAQLCRETLAALIKARTSPPDSALVWAVLFSVSMMRQRYLGAEKDILAEIEEAIAIFTSLVDSFDLMAKGVSIEALNRTPMGNT